MGNLRLQFRSAVLVAAARIMLGRHGTTGTLRHLTRWYAGPIGVERVDALRAVQRAGRLLRAACLPQSVALTAVLTGAGDPPTLVLGCRQYGDGHWGAHAWVVVGGEVLEPVPSGPHAELARLDAASGWVPTQLGAKG